MFGCYGDIELLYETVPAATVSADGTKAACFTFVHICRPAKGIAAFPDGGIPETLYRNACLNILDLRSGELTRIFDLGDLRCNRSWIKEFYFSGDLLVFIFNPPGGWEAELKWKRIDAGQVKALEHGFIYRIGEDSLKQADAESLPSSNENSLTPAEFKEHFSRICWKDRGIDIGKYCPGSKKKRMNQISGLYGNIEYRDALTELLAPELTAAEIEHLIERTEKLWAGRAERSAKDAIKNFTGVPPLLEKLRSIQKEKK